MTVLINQRKPSRGHSKALPPVDLDNPHLRLRIGHLMTFYNLSHSSVHVYLNKGLIPPADGVIRGRRYWHTDTIKNDLEK